MALFIIDFDHTLVKGHTFQVIMRAIGAYPKGSSIEADQEAHWRLVKNLPAITYHQQDKNITWAELIQQMDADGHQIGIASFNKYGHYIIPRFLSETLGLSEELIKKIVINSWLPVNPDLTNKNQHIADIIKEHNYRNMLATVVVIDDDKDNIILKAALNKGFSVVKATDDGLHLRHLKDVVIPMLKPNSQRYENFKKHQKSGPHGIDFNGGIRELNVGLTIEEENCAASTQHNSSNSATLSDDIQFIATSTEATKFAKNMHSGIIISADYKMFYVNKGQSMEFDIESAVIHQWLTKYHYLDRLLSTSTMSLSMHSVITANSEAYQDLLKLSCHPFKQLAVVDSQQPLGHSSVSISNEALFNAKTAQGTSSTMTPMLTEGKVNHKLGLG